MDVLQKHMPHAENKGHHITGFIQWDDQVVQYFLTLRGTTINDRVHIVVGGGETKRILMPGMIGIQLSKSEANHNKNEGPKVSDEWISGKCAAFPNAFHVPQTICFGLLKVETEILIVENAARQVLNGNVFGGRHGLRVSLCCHGTFLDMIPFCNDICKRNNKFTWFSIGQRTKN